MFNVQFTAWTTYTNGAVIGIDPKMTDDYMDCLKHFSRLGHIDHKDPETRNRFVNYMRSTPCLPFIFHPYGSTRLVGLAALAAVVNSDTLYHSVSHFQPQVAIIMAALLLPFFQVDLSVLNHE